MDGRAVSIDSALDVETLGGITVRVDLVGATGGRGRGRRASSSKESSLDTLVETAVTYAQISTISEELKQLKLP